MLTSSINTDMKAFINKVETKLAKWVHEQWNGRKVQMQSLQKQVLARLKGPFDVVPQQAYSKTIAKSDKKPSRHFIRSEAFVNEKVIYRKGPSNRANKVLQVGLWVSYIFLV